MNSSAAESHEVKVAAWKFYKPGAWIAAAGGLALVLERDAEKIQAVQPQDEKMLKASLDGLAEIFGDRCAWWLTGALSIAVAVDQFYRLPGDVDIAAEMAEGEQVVAVAGAADYHLFARVGSTKVGFGRRLTLFRRITWAKMKAGAHGRIRFLRVGPNGCRWARMALIDALDFYLFQTRDGWFSTRFPPMRFPLADLNNSIQTTSSGRKIPLLGTNYLISLKKRRGEEKDRLDLAMLETVGLPSVKPPR